MGKRYLLVCSRYLSTVEKRAQIKFNQSVCKTDLTGGHLFKVDNRDTDEFQVIYFEGKITCRISPGRKVVIEAADIKFKCCKCLYQ